MEDSSLRPSRLYPHDVFSGSHGWRTMLSAHIQNPAAGTAHDSAPGFLAIFSPVPQRQTRGHQNRHAVAGTDAIRNVDVRHVASKLLVPATQRSSTHSAGTSTLNGNGPLIGIGQLHQDIAMAGCVRVLFRLAPAAEHQSRQLLLDPGDQFRARFAVFAELLDRLLDSGGLEIRERAVFVRPRVAVIARRSGQNRSMELPGPRAAAPADVRVVRLPAVNEAHVRLHATRSRTSRCRFAISARMASSRAPFSM